MTFPDAALSDAFRRLIPQPVQTPRLVRVVNVVLPLGSRGTPLDGTERTPAIRLGLNGPATVIAWSLNAMADGIPVAGSVTLDVLAGPSSTSVASICGANRPALIAQVEVNDQPPTGWSPTLLDPCTLIGVLRAVDGVVEVVTLTLRVALNVDPIGGEVVTDDTGAPLTDDTLDPILTET